jgi:hypothetical protein
MAEAVAGQLGLLLEVGDLELGEVARLGVVDPERVGVWGQFNRDGGVAGLLGRAERLAFRALCPPPALPFPRETQRRFARRGGLLLSERLGRLLSQPAPKQQPQ